METPQLNGSPTSRDADCLREELVILAGGCPHYRANPLNCPLHEVRKLDPSSVIDWLDDLTAEEQDFLVLYHQCCLVTNWERDWSERFASARGGSRG